MKRIPNRAYYNPHDGTTTVVVTRMDGTEHEVIVDTWIYTRYPHMSIHVKRMNPGSDKFYAACRPDIGGKMQYLHRVVGAMDLLREKLVNPDSDRTTVDHLNRVSLDCSLRNIRAASRKEQRANQERVLPCQN